MAESNTYSQAEMQRYLQQKMSQQEMHEFEKTLMNDPFLADALEGYAQSDNRLAEEHLETIESALLADQQKAKLVPLPAQKVAWWRVAALVLVIILAGIITYSVVQNTAKHENKVVAATMPKQSSAQQDSIGPIERPLAENGLPVHKLFPPVHSRSQPIIREQKYRLMAMQQPTQDTEMVEQMAASGSSDAASKEQLETQQIRNISSERKTMARSILSIVNEFKGKVVDKFGEPLPFADIKVGDNGTNTLTDKNGNFDIKAADSVLDISVTSPGYVTAKTKIKSNSTNNKIALKDEELSLSEVVVTGLSKRKKSLGATMHVDTSMAAEPEGGWKSFNQYIKRQLDSLRATQETQNFDEDMVLEFSIDKEGQPIDIKLSQNVDKLLAEKVKEILANGPRWDKKKRIKK